MKSKLAIALLIAGLLSIGAWSVQGQRAKAKNTAYQYNVISDPTESLGNDEGLAKLDELGAQGWEIVGVTRLPDNPTRIYLKRTIK